MRHEQCFCQDVDVFRTPIRQSICLPRNECYNMAWYDDNQFLVDIDEGSQPTVQVNMSFDGVALEALPRGFTFDSRQFGEACTPCVAGESELEVFIVRDGSEGSAFPLLSYDVSSRRTLETMASGSVESSEINDRMHHLKMCVPSDGCYSFAASVPETDTITSSNFFTDGDEKAYRESGDFHVRLGDTIFASDSLYFSSKNDIYGWEPDFETKVSIGSTCTASDVCNDSESLISVMLDSSTTPTTELNLKIVTSDSPVCRYR